VDRDEASRILEQELTAYRAESYQGLVRRLSEESLHFERAGNGGAVYQVEIEFMWDGVPGGDVLVIGSIDDGGWRAFVPLTRSFIKGADGSFVGE
jgi:hypothetical protein